MVRLEMLFNFLPNNPDFYQPLSGKKKPSEYILGKGENAGDQHFLLFPQCFLSFQRQVLSLTFIVLSAKAINLAKSKN